MSSDAALSTVPPIDHRKQERSEAKTLARAMISRLGAESPASLLVCDVHLFRFFCEFLPRHPTVEALGDRDENAVIDALKKVSSTSQDVPTTTEMIRAGLAESVASAMMRFKGKPLVAGWGCNVVGALATNDALRKSLTGTGVIEAVVAALVSHSRSNDQLAWAALEAISDITERCVPNKERLGACKGVEAVVSAMRDLQGPRAQYLCLCAIANACFDCAENKERFGELGGVELIVKAMRDYPDHIGVAEWGCICIDCVGFRCPVNKLKAAECGGIQAIVTAMSKHPSDSAQEWGCLAIANTISDNPDNRRLVVESGGLDAILGAMRSHPTVRVHEWAAGALWHLMAKEEYHGLFMTPEVSDALREASKRFPLSTQIRHGLESVTRFESEAIKKARERGTCTLVYAPRCKEPCAAESQYCGGCYSTSFFFSCETCFGSKGDRRFCSTCADRCHGGHAGHRLFIPGSCDCTNILCKVPLKDAKHVEDWMREQRAHFSGWDFSRLKGRMIDDTEPWSYESLACSAMGHSKSLLDLGTGGGEVLSSMHDSWPKKVVATEDYAPNVVLASNTLEPLGARVVQAAASRNSRLPFADGEFDLVICRHTSFNSSEVARVLAPGGVFLTQQVNGRWAEDLMDVFHTAPQWPENTLENTVSWLGEAGLKVVRRENFDGKFKFTDIGAIVYYLRSVPWIVPGFSVETHISGLSLLLERFEKSGGKPLQFRGGKFFVEARKSKRRKK